MCQVTIPVSARLADNRISSTTDWAVIVSPGYTGAWKVHSLTPRNGPPPSLRSSTDIPTTVQSMSIGLTTTSRCPCARAYSTFRCIGFQLHVAVENITLSDSVMVRPQ